MNLKNNKGYVITDASIAIIILLILIPVIMGIIYGIGASKNATEIKSEAVNIAINSIEAAKGLSIEEVSDSNILSAVSNLEFYRNNGNRSTLNDSNVVIETKKGSYILEVSVTDYKDEKEDDENIIANVVKTVKATVKYNAKGEQKQIELSTVVK